MGRYSARRVHGVCVVVLLAPLALNGCIGTTIIEQAKKKRIATIDARLQEIAGEVDGLHVKLDAGEISKDGFNFEFERLAVEKSSLSSERTTLTVPARSSWLNVLVGIANVAGIALGGGALGVGILGGSRTMMFLSRVVPIFKKSVNAIGTVVAAVEHSKAKAVKLKVKDAENPMVEAVFKKMKGG